MLNEITLMVDRLFRAGIPRNNLCFEVDAYEWDELCAELEKLQRHTQDPSPVKPDDMYILGFHVRKRIGQ